MTAKKLENVDRRCAGIQLFTTQWTVTHPAPLSMGLSRQEYWSQLAFPLQGDLPDSGWNLGFLCLLHWQVDSLPLSHLGSPEDLINIKACKTQNCVQP